MIDRTRWLLPRRALALGTALVAVYLVVITAQQAVEAYRSNQEVDAVRQQISDLRTQNLALQGELAQNHSDEQIEQVAREELGLQKPGDHVFSLTWQDAPSPAAEQPAVAPPEPNWRNWVKLFFDPNSNG